MSCSRTVEAARAWHEESAAVASRFRSSCPDLTRLFGTLLASAMKDGALSALRKESIALGLGGRDPPRALHRRPRAECLALGATQAVLEFAGVAVMMGGGPVGTSVAVLISALEACGQAKVGPA